MSIFNFSAQANGAHLVFDPAADVLAFDSGSINASQVRLLASGGNLANAPKLQANAALNYEWRLGDRIDMFVGADYAHKDAISGRTQDPISDYNLLNARLGIKSADDHWSATLWGRNLTDKKYNAEFSPGGFLFRALPRRYGLDLEYRF